MFLYHIQFRRMALDFHFQNGFNFLHSSYIFSSNTMWSQLCLHIINVKEFVHNSSLPSYFKEQNARFSISSRKSNKSVLTKQNGRNSSSYTHLHKKSCLTTIFSKKFTSSHKMLWTQATYRPSLLLVLRTKC